MTTAEATRNAAYHTIRDLPASRAKVLLVIERMGPISNSRIAHALGWSVNRVTGRTRELVEAGLVVDCGTELSEFGKSCVR